MCDDHDERHLQYKHIEDIDASRMLHVFRNISLFDDMFLNMQAMNIAVVDMFITQIEYDLLREYFEIERTPTDSAAFVSAQSQMWIFAVYELLRTWRARVIKLMKWKDEGKLDEQIARFSKIDNSLVDHMQFEHIERMKTDANFYEKVKSDRKKIFPLINMIDNLRVNLAKHEVKGERDMRPRAPGYGRINGYCGALDFEVDIGDGSYHVMNRRDIADAIRELQIEEP
ncbi:hypothetical protein CFR75_15605 [Komagataeibacter xylinus]|uniref:Uncharacterized protein n=1 Tax=Komagataeibacter xylinus TaxID=28448 RepID=A0A318PHL0_KOMXY|nr:hypothetical protein [Komagataeibacter xylinus]PYD55605.1 hypothetical protein CFR75_15605 [Komagataeibacter xylinus]